MSLPFTGEMMKCEICGREQQSNPRIESGWFRFDFIFANCVKYFYICPDCFKMDKYKLIKKLIERLRRW